MKLSDKLDEIIKLNYRKMYEITNVPLPKTRRIGRYDYVLEFEESLIDKIKEQRKIGQEYDSKINMIYEQINNDLENGEKLINPFN